jgi:hypothetical protein
MNRSSEPTPEYGAPWLPVTGTRLPADEHDQEHALEDDFDCGHDPSGGDCDYDCPRFARSHAGF